MKKQALITGATSGIGRATALRLAKEGYAVIATGRRADRLATLRAEIEAAGGRCTTLAFDVRSEEEVRRNLRMPVRFESFLYPVSGRWRGRMPVLSNDLSCGGAAFFCARKLEVDEVAEIVIPVTAEPLVLRVKILRERPSPDPIPLYAAEFVDMLREEENMVCEAVFSLQFRHTAEM